MLASLRILDYTHCMKVGKITFSWPLAHSGLVTQFAVYSLICIAVMTAALWWMVSSYLVRQILDREWQTTAQIVRADVRKFLQEYDFKAEDRKSVGPKFSALLEHMRLFPEIVRFKVYSPTGVVLWSDDKRLVGKSFLDNPELRQALRGQVVADVSPLDKEENVFEQASLDRAVEVYVPIFSDSGALLGVFETYKRADALYRDLRQARIIVLLGALGGGLLLYLALFTMVRQAARKIQEQQANLLRMQAELIASQRLAAIGEMAAAVAHGIGNPLSAVRALAQVAVLESESAAGSTLQNLNTRLQNIVGQVDRVQKRMQGLLNLAKPVEPFPIMVDVNKLLRDIVDGLRPQLDQAGVAAQLELDAALPRVELDPTQLEQVFTGLIDNAVEASSPGGEVTISTQAADANGSGKELRVCIEDTGAGIPAENRERVFEPFFTTKPQGTGLGLALAKKFVERNGGIIKILEGPRGGAKIEVTFAR